MEMAITELKNFASIPVKVTLNEYIEISKTYSTPKSRQFINGILDKLVADFREKGLIQKSGRGLME
jgi:N utilization substance protein B